LPYAFALEAKKATYGAEITGSHGFTLIEILMKIEKDVPTVEEARYLLKKDRKLEYPVRKHIQ
jgi:hypothetical protein